MAAKTRARKAIEDAKLSAIHADETRKTYEMFVEQAMSEMTIESALEEQKWVEENPVGCACNVYGPKCCLVRSQARKRILE